MKFTIDKNLIEKIGKLTATDYGVEEYYNDDKKVWFDIDNFESLLDDLMYEIECRDDRITDLEFQRDNPDNYNPELEIPEIHGKGISW